MSHYASNVGSRYRGSTYYNDRFRRNPAKREVSRNISRALDSCAASHVLPDCHVLKRYHPFGNGPTHVLLRGQMVKTAKIIFFHGASSSGKSTLARGVQAAIDQPFWHISIDHLRDAGVLPSGRIRSGEFAWASMRQQFFSGFHLSLAAYASAGNNLLIEHILDTEGWLTELTVLFAPFDVFFVGVHCSLPELVRREQARGDRQVGSAEQDYKTIHRNLRYDLEIQSEGNMDENVERVISAWTTRSFPSAFTQMAGA
jgi:chloramphenicol 3-O phosphotransferase